LRLYNLEGQSVLAFFGARRHPYRQTIRALMSGRASKALEEKSMAKTGIKVVVVGVIVLFACSISMLAQAAQKPSPQGVSGGSEQSSSVRDQDIEMLRADIRAQRKQITAQNMDLTAEEATKFWPVFDEYRKEAIKANDERWALIKDYAANYSTMTDAQAQDYIKRSTVVDQQLLELRMKYVPMFEKVISSKKTALWYQIDRRIDLLINLQLSAAIPMVNTTK
jgi:Spy/CpxP family protein refolding chaperone